MQLQFPKNKLTGFSFKSTAGLPPGQLIHIGEKLTDKSVLELISYNADDMLELSSKDADDILGNVDHNKINWLNIDGLHNLDLIKKVGDDFSLHPLMLEDILNTQQRPKSEEYDKQLFFTLKTLNSVKNDVITYEQISFVLGDNYLLSFQEKEGDLFDGLRTRMRTDPASKARKKGVDYLFYRLIDTIVDSYYLILENLGERIELLDDEVHEKPDKVTLRKIQNLKKELIFLRKSIYPLRESISQITKGEYPFIKKETIRFFSDVYDHTIHVVETFETYRDLVSGLMDMYMTSISNKMNEVMKVLTIMASIFIPLTFLAGVYGMNFEHMPELGWKYGYYTVWGAMILIAGGMIIYFRKKDWL